MQPNLPTIILRHKRENLKKCTLRSLESREDFRFFSYPITELPPLENYVILSFDAPPLTKEDAHKGLFLVDATWRYAEKIERVIAPTFPMEKRSLPIHYRTAYPRRQEDCPDPVRGLASIEALYIAYHILERDADSLLENYYWKDEFLSINSLTLNKKTVKISF